MIPFMLTEAARVVAGRLHPQSEEMNIYRLFTDSRECDGGKGLFFALRGEKCDGNTFVDQVVGAGNAALVDDERAFVKNTILVSDVKKAVYQLACWYRSEKCPEVKAVCITGSVGKTTTKDMTGLIFSACADTYVTGGNRNSLIGVPLSVMSIDSKNEYAVLELGMSERGEIEKLSRLAKPYLSVITAIGSSHLEALGSIENIKNEKFDILKGERPEGKIVLNADNPLERDEGLKLGERAIFCSLQCADADFFAHDISETDTGSRFVIRHKCSETVVNINVPGVHNVSNALLSFAAGVSCGFESKKCAEALERYTSTGNRQHKYVSDGITIIADCYNASPESMSAALDVLASADGRKIAVLGDMLELGGDSERLHREVAVKAASSADVLVFIGDMAEIYRDAAERDCLTYGIGEKSEAASRLKTILKSGDTVLFKASNRLHLEDIIKELGL